MTPISSEVVCRLSPISMENVDDSNLLWSCLQSLQYLWSTPRILSPGWPPSLQHALSRLILRAIVGLVNLATGHALVAQDYSIYFCCSCNMNLNRNSISVILKFSINSTLPTRLFKQEQTLLRATFTSKAFHIFSVMQIYIIKISQLGT